jgi:hypothetical protein
MASHPSSNAGTARTVIYQPMKNRETLGPYNDSTPAIGLQHLGNANFQGAPQVPSTAATRKNTPIRPVYDDFTTAYSSITSRSANGRSRDVLYKNPKQQTGLVDRGRPLSRRVHKSLRRQKKPPGNEALTLPVPVKVSHHRPIFEFDFDITDARFTSSWRHETKLSLDHPPNMVIQKKASASPFLDSLKKAMGGKSSSIVKPFQSRLSLSFKWPRDSMELSVLARKVDKPTRKEPEDGHGDTRSPQESGKTRLPDLPFYLEDPFVHEDSQDLRLLEGRGAGHVLALDGNQHNRESSDFQDNAGSGHSHSHSKPTVYGTLETPNYFHGSITLAIESKRTLSTREGSTVDNIVKQCASNNGLWDISLGSNDGDSIEDGGHFHHFKTQKEGNSISVHSPSGDEHDIGRGNKWQSDVKRERPFWAFKLVDSSGRAPSTGLPQIPSLADQQTLKSTSEGLQQSSSYGDTRNLLEITQRSQWVTATGPTDTCHGKVPQTDRTTPSNTNLLRSGPNQNLVIPSIAAADSSPNSRLSQKLTADANGSTENLVGIPLLALERDISRTLRHMSAFSNLSRETSANYQGDGGCQSSTDSSGLLSFISKQNQHAPEPPKLATRGFYHESAIHQTWLDSQRIEHVRIPIHRNVSVSSLPRPHLASHTTDEFDLGKLDGLERNETEWETVVDGVISRVKTAGSSLANNSSAGNISPILYEHNDFSSTDRIVQHPAQIDYPHEYRYKEIKEGKFPVLLPSYLPHTVNGFPANSYKSINPFQQSSGNFYQPPPPLSRSHTNPFRSPPPEVITNKSESSNTVDRDGFLIDPPPKLKLATPSQEARGDHSDQWMDEFGDPGPAIGPTSPTPILRATDHSIHILSESCSGSKLIGSSIADASSSALSTIIHELENLREVQKWGVSRSSHAARYTDGTPSAARERATFIKGPPGAFYQGVRSRPDPHRKGRCLDRKGVAILLQTKAAQRYPTNQMRPLSLLQDRWAAGTDGSRPGGRLNDNFLYRTPLAPIKSSSWCDLYTKEQLSSMHTDAKNDGITNLEHIPWRYSRPAFGEAVKTDGSWKRTWSPHLRPWPRDNSSIKTDLSGRKIKISSLIFGLCCLFPPMLVLYGVGYLDNMMLWITKGEISSFSKAHKKTALQVVCFFIIAILIAVPIIIAIKVIGSK